MRQYSNENVATKKQKRSGYAREDPSKITAKTLMRMQALSARFPAKTRYKRAARRGTSVHKTCYQRAINTLLCAKTHYGVQVPSALHDTGALTSALHDTGEFTNSPHDTGELTSAHDTGEVPSHC